MVPLHSTKPKLERYAKVISKLKDIENAQAAHMMYWGIIVITSIALSLS